MFLEEIVENDAMSKLLKFRKINDDGCGALAAIAPGDFRRNGLPIGEDPINDAAAGMTFDGAQVVGQGIAGGFARLSHKIGDIDARRPGFGDGVGDFRDEQVGKDAGVKRTRAEQNQVRVTDGLDRFGERAHRARQQSDFLDGRAAGRDARFTVNFAAILQRSHEGNHRSGGRENTAANGEDFAAHANGFGKVAGNVRQRRQEEVAEIVANEAAPGMEAILKEMAEQVFILGKRDHTVANVSRRKNAILAAQAAGAAAIIRNGDDGSEVGDRPLPVGRFIPAANDVVFYSTEKG